MMSMQERVPSVDPSVYLGGSDVSVHPPVLVDTAGDFLCFID